MPRPHQLGLFFKQGVAGLSGRGDRNRCRALSFCAPEVCGHPIGQWFRHKAGNRSGQAHWWQFPISQLGTLCCNRGRLRLRFACSSRLYFAAPTATPTNGGRHPRSIGSGLCAMQGQQIVGLEVIVRAELDESRFRDLIRRARLPLAFLIPKSHCPGSIGRGFF
jgi:hypothetical protein